MENKKRTQFCWTQDTAQRACDLRKAGRTNEAICEELGCTQTALNNLFGKLRKNGVEVPRAPGWRQALDLAQLGLTFQK
jgi:biotin operon repressor